MDGVTACGGETFNTTSAYVLSAEGLVVHSLDVAVLGEDNDDVFLWKEVFVLD